MSHFEKEKKKEKTWGQGYRQMRSRRFPRAPGVDPSLR